LYCRLTRRLLGQILVDGEFVTRHDLERALERQKKTNEHLGEILVGMGVIDQGDLRVVLSIQGGLASLKESVRLAAGVRGLLGELLVRGRRITPEQLHHAMKEQQRTGERLGEVLMRLGLITGSELDAVLTFQRHQGGEVPSSESLRLGEILVAANHITREQLEDALARQRVSKKKIGEVLVEAGYAQPHHVQYGLRLQHRLVTAALIATLTLATGQGGGEVYAASSAVTVTATVQAYADMKVIRQPSELIVTSADILRGYVDVPMASIIEVRGNNPEGYLLSFELGGPFKGAVIKGLGREVQIGQGNSLVSQPYSRGAARFELGYRFILSQGAGPGTYTWPSAISVLPR
jgi:hypothetical protein